MSTTSPRASRDAGFSLLELLVSMAIVLVVMGATLTALNDAYRSTEAARGVTGLNNNLRIGIDLIVRDFIQVGQLLPTGRVVMIPANGGATPVNRPHPQGGAAACQTWAAGTTQIPAVSVGPGCGQAIDGVPTDIVTTIAGDTSFDHVDVAAADAAAHTVTIVNTVDISGGNTDDDIRVGDLIMLTKTTFSSLLYVTAVAGQVITFATGDPMNLNQFDDTLVMTGTMDQVFQSAPAGANGMEATRIRMITYYLDATLDPAAPRLVRHLNWGDPNAAENLRGRTVAFSVENLQFTYDLVDGDATPPTNVRMVDQDLTINGACAPAACSPNQIRKINVFLAARSQRRFVITNEFFRNSLATQVSLRSLALVDRYR